MLRKILLWPFQSLYALVLHIRHKAFDSGLLKSQYGEIPTFVLGNLHAGGTGKTPHASYFLELFSEKLGGEKHVALLSRGYKRKSTGFLEVESSTDWRMVGDEPALLKSKHANNPIFVCEDRLEGIRQIKALKPEVKVVILDDGLQHRRLIPHKSLLLLDSNRPLKDASLLPIGGLRDLKSRIDSFDAACIARCSDTYRNEINKQGIQMADVIIFESSMKNEGMEPSANKPRVIAVSGIAEPGRFMESLNKSYSVVRQESYADHFEFTEKNVKSWLTSIRNEKLEGLVTTTKDAVRIRPLIKDIEEINLISIGIEVEWENEFEIRVWVGRWLESTIFATNN